MRQLLDCWNRIFFPCKMDLESTWRSNDDKGWDAPYGRCCAKGDGGSLIEMNSSRVKRIEGALGFSGNVISRLDTLLHECIHAYINQNACEECPTWKHNKDHGQAFQRLALKLEEKVLEFLKLPLPLSNDRFVGLTWSDRKHRTALPSVHDLQEWKFDH